MSSQASTWFIFRSDFPSYHNFREASKRNQQQRWIKVSYLRQHFPKWTCCPLPDLVDEASECLNCDQTFGKDLLALNPDYETTQEELYDIGKFLHRRIHGILQRVGAEVEQQERFQKEYSMETISRRCRSPIASDEENDESMKRWLQLNSITFEAQTSLLRAALAGQRRCVECLQKFIVDIVTQYKI
jgi:hypothetical protein